MSVQNICSTKAYAILVSNDNAFLVDVRTREEWKQVGIPHLDNKNKVIFLSWQLNKDFEDNFLSIVNDKIHAMIFFLCRSGYRSFTAANFIANIGYKNCYNISDGFEGNNQNKGWKQNNLPWQF
ncbi:MAG: rhodanese-like domain-containing protein [Rickettsia endosymbiont of Ixodes persulcatus]|nr:rhodanese-like domain-containing protein [Rickettsia endosymbiont of Ixodes persulcatus]MCZ6901323.1 rhodanese-like domain-containing protein [Rickettsia endosymbiont of Ixodes persulcatus]MCZ6903146.1 rhodanese-like domain-containing protein [Rickettsia endosymbiont of Ixodes persulcatus]MCZ6908988.1 rhodanese-like domain-containing protein [Rickettsia endosymbiont of Ixodes persulcatus]MCZ6910946.1 rhodanese-like domain-containing protein [Rickettsia endosymbiont of Ixodes persulcatus]